MDPNWLLSSAAQSAAALVGIVAALLISRLLAVAQERQANTMRLAELRKLRTAKEQRLTALHAAITRREVDWFIERVLDTIVAKRGHASLPELMREKDPGHLTQDDIRPAYDETAEAVKEAYALFEAVADDISKLPGDFDEAAKLLELEVSPGKREVYRAVYRAVRRKYKPRGFGMIAFDWTDIQPPRITPVTEIQEHAALERERDALELECRLLQEQERELEARLYSLTLPRSVWVGIGVLAYFSAVGIVLPMSLMPASPDFSVGTKWTVLGLFVSGLAAVLLYLVWTAATLGATIASIVGEQVQTTEPRVSEGGQVQPSAGR